MLVEVVIFVPFVLSVVVGNVYLYNTEDGPSIEFFDCINYEKLLYCRRPSKPIHLDRENLTRHCNRYGKFHSFASLRSTNINLSTILHQWGSSIEKAEEYSRFTSHYGGLNGYLCECNYPNSFGKNCEYLLPTGNTFEETLRWEVKMKKTDMFEISVDGDILCYKTLECNSGLLCLDWRDICDGVQQCLFGIDEENCDRLEFNECESDEYRCMNGMCIPDEYFLDGEHDCMDWSDEMQYYDDALCPLEEASFRCDDHVCQPNKWSCGDGQCIVDRLRFQRTVDPKFICWSRRDKNHICEMQAVFRLWTLPNGQCIRENKYKELNFAKRTILDECQYLVKCALSAAAEMLCPCRSESCADRIKGICPHQLIQYPIGGIMAPYILFLYNRTRKWGKVEPNYIHFNGTIKCRGFAININKLYLYSSWTTLRDIEDMLCRSVENESVIENSGYDPYCHHQSRSFNNRTTTFVDICNKSRECVSSYRITDGIGNCIDKADEQRDKRISSACSSIRRHRFRCSVEDPTCLSVITLGDSVNNCNSKWDELWMGTGRKLSNMYCNRQSNDECEALRQYIEISWTSTIKSESNLEKRRIPFRSYCDTFLNLGSQDDENLIECRKWWACAPEQWECDTRQCIDEDWVLDTRWDCSDASDEEGPLERFLSDWNVRIIPSAIIEARLGRYINVPSVFSKFCDINTEFPCLRINLTFPLNNFTHNRPCISQDRIGNGHIDCYGAIDERNILQHCDKLKNLEFNFKCLSSEVCIPYTRHCNTQRCPNKSDDRIWCDRQQEILDCNGKFDFICFNSQCVTSSRCNGKVDCPFGEDEYMCNDYRESVTDGRFTREHKESLVKARHKKLRLTNFPNDTNTTEPSSDVVLTSQTTSKTPTSPSLISSETLYFCNRGIKMYMRNGSIVCFCSPQYYGDKCQFHNDRITVLLHLNLSQSIYTGRRDNTIVIKLLVLLLFQSHIRATREFHVRPGIEIDIYNKKLSCFPYSRSLQSLQQRKARFFNRWSIVNEQPYSVHIEAYELKMNEPARRIAVWQYPVYFDYLPVFRLAKVLRLTKLNIDRNPCASNPCNQLQQCHQVLNENSKYVCLCKSHYGGENCSVRNEICGVGYCSTNALCMTNYQDLRTENELPYCICPYGYYGKKCGLVHDGCLASPCQNGGSCFSTSKPNEMLCSCPGHYYGKSCEWKKSGIELYINENVKHLGAVVQYFHIQYTTLDLSLAYQQVHRNLPTYLYYSHLQKTVPEIIVVKLYRVEFANRAEIYLISLHINFSSIKGATQVTEQNRCVHVRALFASPEGNVCG